MKRDGRIEDLDGNAAAGMMLFSQKHPCHAAPPDFALYRIVLGKGDAKALLQLRHGVALRRAQEG
jgi:hypothetical protein